MELGLPRGAMIPRCIIELKDKSLIMARRSISEHATVGGVSQDQLESSFP